MAHACFNGKDILEYGNTHLTGRSTGGKINSRLELDRYQQDEVESELRVHGLSINLAGYIYG